MWFWFNESLTTTLMFWTVPLIIDLSNSYFEKSKLVISFPKFCFPTLIDSIDIYGDIPSILIEQPSNISNICGSLLSNVLSKIDVCWWQWLHTQISCSFEARIKLKRYLKNWIF